MMVIMVVIIFMYVWSFEPAEFPLVSDNILGRRCLPDAEPRVPLD